MNSIDIFNHIHSTIFQATESYNIKFNLSMGNTIEMGTISSNFILILKSKKIPENQLNTIINNIKNNFNPKIVKTTEIFNGFFNITIDDEIYQENLINIINRNEENFFIINNEVKTFRENIGTVHFEFGSINPTGPIHLGHMRSIIVAQCLCNLYESFHIPVYKEFFLNNCGNQINEFLKSIYMRWQQSQNININEDYIPYKGEYIKDLIPKMKDSTEYQDFVQYLPDIIETVKNKTLNQLKEININYDNVVYESKLRQNYPLIINVFNDLIQKKLVAIIDDNGNLLDLEYDFPQYTNDINEIPHKTIILLTKNLGFEKNKVLMKNGELTYFGADVIYLYDKFHRGFHYQYCFLGEDHIGHLTMLKTLGDKLFNNLKFLPKKVGFVKVFNENKEMIPMSKRKGKFLSMEQAKTIIGLDFLKIIMISRTMSSELIFHIYNAQEQNLKNNCLFYIQYCYARISSVLKKIPQDLLNNNNFNTIYKGNILPEEYYILRQLFWMDQYMNNCTLEEDVNGIYQWIYNLSSYFHSYFNVGSKNHQYKFIVDDKNVTLFRIKILLAVEKSLGFILKNIIAIEPLSSM